MKPRPELLRSAARVQREAERLLSETEVARRVERTLFDSELRSTPWLAACCEAAIRRENLHAIPRDRWSCLCSCHHEEPERTGLGWNHFDRGDQVVLWTQFMTPWDSRCGSLDLNWEAFPDLYADLVDEVEAARLGLEYYDAMQKLTDGS